MSYIERFKHNGLTVEIMQDEDAESPRQWENIGTMVCFHKRYKLGDSLAQSGFPLFDSPQALNAFLSAQKDTLLVLPLFLMDHSGLTMRTDSAAFKACDSAGWDWGQVGVIYVTHEKIVKEFGACNEETIAKARGGLIQEVETYSQYLAGEVYGYVIEDEDSNNVDSCFGMFGFEYCKKEAMAQAERSIYAPVSDADYNQLELAFFN